MGDDRGVVLARELTKRYEEFLRGTAQELVEWAKDNDIRGEFVVMIAGYQGVVEEKKKSDDLGLSVHDAVATLISRGLKPNMAIKQIAKSRGLDRQAVYSDYHDID